MTTHQKPVGFRSRNPNALTAAERMRRWRLLNGSRQFFVQHDISSAAAGLYLQKQWGFRSQAETARVAIRYLAVLTRMGLKRIDLTID